MKFRRIFLFFMTVGTVLGLAGRLWFLTVAVDDQGLPVAEHPATMTFIGVGLVFLLILMLLAVKSPGRCGGYQVLGGTPLQVAFGILGAVCFLGGAVWTIAGGGTAAVVLGLLGIAAALCMIFGARNRARGISVPPLELMPVVYLVVKLVLNFKNWSTDPVILDYCDMLFAQCFVLLAFYEGAGFCFGKGRPRRTLFYGACGVLLSGMAAGSCLMRGSIGEALFYMGAILWLLPMVWCMAKENAPEE